MLRNVQAKQITAVAALLLCWGSSLWAADRPNVVWLISEDNSSHYLELFDPHGAPTPEISKLASQGLLYRNAFSNSPVCSVARTTLMTSCLAPRIGTQFHRKSVSVPMPLGVKMFPAYLREAGYYTTNNSKKDYNADETPGTWDASSRRANWRGRKSGQPFFHMQTFTGTHEGSLHFPQSDLKNRPNQTSSSDVFVAPYHPDTPLFRYTIARYHDNIQKIDAQIGRVVQKLADDGLLEDTFIFYFGDHGGVLPRGKGYAYESGLHVPLVVRVPENFRQLSPSAAGTSLDGFVQFIDFGVTALSLAGIPTPSGMDGKPFLGADVTAADVQSRDAAIGYADRFDEKCDLVRTLRKGRFEYIRNYQPFNFDGLQNNYRYKMLAFRQWRQLYEEGKLNESQSQFFRTRPVEQLFDIEADPHEVHNLAKDPVYAETLQALRGDLQQQLKSMPDLSFYPESVLAEEAFAGPAAFGDSHREHIGKLIDIADLSLLPFAEARQAVVAAFQSPDSTSRYWGLVACSCFGQAAAELASAVRSLSKYDSDLLVRTRAAEFLALIGLGDPRETIMDCLAKSTSEIEANLILNTVVLLQDGECKIEFQIGEEDVHPRVAKGLDVKRRLAYLSGSLPNQ